MRNKRFTTCYMSRKVIDLRGCMDGNLAIGKVEHVKRITLSPTPSPGFTAKPLVGRFHVPLSFWLLEMDRWWWARSSLWTTFCRVFFGGWNVEIRVLTPETPLERGGLGDIGGFTYVHLVEIHFDVVFLQERHTNPMEDQLQLQTASLVA